MPFRSRRARQRGILGTSFDCLIMITSQSATQTSTHSTDAVHGDSLAIIISKKLSNDSISNPYQNNGTIPYQCSTRYSTIPEIQNLRIQSRVYQLMHLGRDLVEARAERTRNGVCRPLSAIARFRSRILACAFRSLTGWLVIGTWQNLTSFWIAIALNSLICQSDPWAYRFNSPYN